MCKLKRVNCFLFKNVLLILMLAFFGISGCDVTSEDLTDDSEENNNVEGHYAQSNYKWYKGNLHAHSYWSNGYDYPEMVLDWYKSHGYKFAVISPHNALQKGDKWIEAEKGSHGEKMFKNYLDAYGEGWVEYEDQDSLYRVHLKTLEQYRPRLEGTGNFMVLSSEEIDYENEENLIHVNTTNIREVIKPQPGGSVTEILQNTIDAVNAQSEQMDVPIISQVNHPNITWSITAEDLKPP